MGAWEQPRPELSANASVDFGILFVAEYSSFEELAGPQGGVVSNATYVQDNFKRSTGSGRRSSKECEGFRHVGLCVQFGRAQRDRGYQRHPLRVVTRHVSRTRRQVDLHNKSKCHFQQFTCRTLRQIPECIRSFMSPQQGDRGCVRVFLSSIDHADRRRMFAVPRRCVACLERWVHKSCTAGAYHKVPGEAGVLPD